MTPRAWLYFAIVSIVWGIPYLFIKEAVTELSPVVVAFARLAIGVLVLLPLAASTGALRGLGSHLGKIVVLATIEIIGPFIFIATGEQTISSSLTGILIATEPLLIALLATWLDPSERVTGWRFVGLLLGLVGVATALGMQLGSGTAFGGALLILGASLGYAAGALLVKRWFAGLPAQGVTAAALTVAAVALALPAMLLKPHTLPSPQVLGALLVLGIACTGIGFLTFFLLIYQAGSVRASLITYVAPVVAILLGVRLRGEIITPAIIVGFVLILAGSWFTTGGRLPTRNRVAPAP